MHSDVHLTELLRRYVQLYTLESDIFQAYTLMKECFSTGGTVFLCGNGGSASDAEHIAGELMKGFLLKRRVGEEIRKKFESLYGEQGIEIANSLQMGLRAISLLGHPSLSSAFANDVNAELVFAQQMFVLAKKGDLLIAISTSGNSKNVVKAMQVAKVVGAKCVALTGNSGGLCTQFADCSIKVPETETYKIQELHLPIYHCLCAMIEDFFFNR